MKCDAVDVRIVLVVRITGFQIYATRLTTTGSLVITDANTVVFVGMSACAAIPMGQLMAKLLAHNAAVKA